MIGQLWARIRPELPKLGRFVVIGTSLLLVTLAFYSVLNRWIWPSGPAWVHYAIVTLVMTVTNYVLNSRITFQATDRDVGMKLRFVCVVICATLMNNGLFWIFHEQLHLPDFLVIIGNAGIISLVTFSGHRLFTFHSNPWRWLSSWCIMERHDGVT